MSAADPTLLCAEIIKEAGNRSAIPNITATKLWIIPRMARQTPANWITQNTVKNFRHVIIGYARASVLPLSYSFPVQDRHEVNMGIEIGFCLDAWTAPFGASGNPSRRKLNILRVLGPDLAAFRLQCSISSISL
jgi:hypothetical protein